MNTTTQSPLQQISESLSFAGRQLRFQHESSCCQCDMTFSIYLPPQAEEQGARLPVLYWLSGLTCTDENFVQKSGFQRYAAQHGVVVVAPDTSPRGKGVPDDPDGSWDMGLGAGFYVNATQEPWRTHYQMYDYVSAELPEIIAEHFPVDTARQGIFGHSMGGHGALVIGLRNPDCFRSISAFAPIVNPANCPWGQKALGYYLGEAGRAWNDYDALALLEEHQPQCMIKIDQGGADSFLEAQLHPERLVQLCQNKRYPLEYHLYPGYDHSYFFIASFIGSHFQFHLEQLNQSA
ncbi:MAG: S-formylglutathione hydrolase [Pseudomonadales bacterium]|nr:S-formylglutathione hydrolase [Pseudomonadales bacterium]